MRYLLLSAVLLFSLPGCIKIQDISCGSQITPPALVSSTITVNQGDTLVLSVLSPTPGNVYEWFGLSNSPVFGNPAYVFDISTSQAGTWSVITGKPNTICFSDSTRFNVDVNVDIPKCGQTNNTMVLDYSTINFTYDGITNADPDYYSYNYVDNYGNSLYIYFPSQPVSGGYITDEDYYYLEPGQCNITYTNTADTYITYGGEIYVKVVGGSVTIGFCNILFLGNYTGNEYSANGLFVN